MGNFLINMLAGYNEAQHQRYESKQAEELFKRKNLLDFYSKEMERPDIKPEAKDIYRQRYLGLTTLPYGKKLPKEFESDVQVVTPGPSQDIQPPSHEVEGMKVTPPTLPVPRSFEMGSPLYTPEEMREQEHKEQKFKTGEELRRSLEEIRTRAEEQRKTEAAKPQVSKLTPGSLSSEDLDAMLQQQGTTARGPVRKPGVRYKIRQLPDESISEYWEDKPPATSKAAKDAETMERAWAMVNGLNPDTPLTDVQKMEAKRWGAEILTPKTRIYTDPITGETTTSIIPRPTLSGGAGTGQDLSARENAIQTMADEVEQRGADELPKGNAARVAVINELQRRGSLLADKKDKDNIVQLGKVWNDLQLIRKQMARLREIPVTSKKALEIAATLHGIRIGLGRVMTRKVFLEVGNLSQSDANAGLALLPGTPSAVAWQGLAEEKLAVLEDIIKRMQDGYLELLKRGLKIDKDGKVIGPGVIKPEAEKAVRLQAPDGTIKEVSESEAQHYLDLGAKRIQ